MAKPSPILFKIMAAALPFAVLLLVEVGLRLPPARESDPFVDIGPFSLCSEVEISGEKYYKITHESAYDERETVFAARKKPGTTRLFCLGGSASAGWPHPPDETYSRYLQQALQRAYPGRNIEVIDVSAHGFASYRIRKIFDEVLEYQPDALIIYSGNNEFLEKRSFRAPETAAWLEWAAAKLKTVGLVKRLIHKKPELPAGEIAGLAAVFWKKVKKEALELRSDPELFEKVKEHYAVSMEHMARTARRKGVPLIFLTVPVNLRDWLPNVSGHAVEGADLKDWERLFRQGRKHLLREEFSRAEEALMEAARLDPEHAETFFRLARALEKQNRHDAALENYVRAKDLDYNPFRAHSAFNDSLRRIAPEYGALLVDLEKIFRRAARNGLPGFDLFLDYVHPAKKGNLLIAEGVFHQMLAEKALPGSALVSDFQIQEKEPPYEDAKDLNMQGRLFGILCYNHQYGAAIAKGRFILSRFPREKLEKFRREPFFAVIHEGLRALGAWREMQRREILGLPVSPEEKQAVMERYDGFYAKWFQYGSF